jgi:hypothetical protein
MEQYFAVCKDKTVLEIGPNDGVHTKLISKQSPKYLELIEPRVDQFDTLNQIENVNNIIVDDAFFVLSKKRSVDVVVCCGVLYHLHSPLYLLELITNNCDPDYIILDCAVDQKNISFLIEEDNKPGNRQLIPQWKSTGYNLVAPFEIINQALKNMGYILIKTDKIDTIEGWGSKDNFWTGIWKKEQ